MADSVTIKFRAQYAENGDYGTLPLSLDYGDGKDYISAIPTRHKKYRESIPTTGTTFTMSDFTTITTALIHNQDLVNYVTATWTSGETTNSQTIPPGQPLLIPQAETSNVVLTANAADCMCVIIIFGT